ncbi:MAG: glycosyltransferase family 4 protein [Candidatus Omnitrophota bacterium]
MAKTNLLYVITKLELGGAQTQLLSLIRRIDPAQYNIFLFTAREGILMNDALKIPGLHVHRSRFLERAVNPILDIPAFLEIFSFIKRNNIRIVHTHSSKAGILGRLAAAAAGVQRIYHTVHGWPFHPYQNGVVRAVYVLLERIAAAATTKIIVVCRTDKDRGLRAAIGRPDLYEIIPYGIDASEFGRPDPSIRKALGIEAGALVVGTVACFKPQKAPLDFLWLAEVLVKTMPDIVCVMVGDGSLRVKIEQFILGRGLARNIILTGWRRDIPKILAAFDVFVLTSHWEGLPISVMEAFAASLPVVATDTGGIAELIHDPDNGFLAAPGDVVSLSQKVIALLQDTKLRQYIGTNARRSLSVEWNPCYSANRTQSVYNR